MQTRSSHAHQGKFQARAKKTAMGRLHQHHEEMSNGMRTVKISGQEIEERDRPWCESGNPEIDYPSPVAQALVPPTMDLVLLAFRYVP